MYEDYSSYIFKVCFWKIYMYEEYSSYIFKVFINFFSPCLCKYSTVLTYMKNDFQITINLKDVNVCTV